MRLEVISFTENGIRLSQRLAETWDGCIKSFQEQHRSGGNRFFQESGTAVPEGIALYTKCGARAPQELCNLKKGQSTLHPVEFVEQSVGNWAGERMREGRCLLFIGACGIAVRAIAPHLLNKLCDSPVLVMDERGQYVIPILSGHYGGANRIAGEIAAVLGAVPVITTATDLNHKFAVDLFAKKNGLLIVNRDGIAKVSAKVLANREITLSVETGHVREGARLPEGIRLVPYPPEGDVDVLVTGEEKVSDAALVFRPREYAFGVGCRKGKEAEEIEAFLLQCAGEAGIPLEHFFALASIDRKREEPGLISWSEKHRVPFLTYTAAELWEAEGEFQASAFVLEKTGVDNVCERAALKACGSSGRLVYGKHAEDGMTSAIAKREWSVAFDEE